MGGHGLHGTGCGQGQVMGCCEFGNELSACIKCRTFLD